MANVKVNPAEKVASQAGFRTISGSRRAGTIFKLIVVTLASLLAIYPMIYVVSASFSATNSLSELVPSQPTTANYEKLVNDQQYPFMLWLFNSVKVSGISTIITLALCAMAAYSFSRLRFRGRRAGLLLILLIQLFPNLLALVSIYLLIQQIGDIIPWLGLNTHAGLIMVYCGGALGFNTWLMKGFFDTVPKEIDESATVDGASKTQIFTLILLPLVRPILAVITILSFIGTYSDFLLAKVLLSSKENYTLAVGLTLLNDVRTTNWGQFSAAALVGALPIVIMFLLLQKQLVGGLTSGSVKG
jgi:ABC-type maltose transport system permease subunit